MATRRQRVISEFARLRQFLEEQHGALLAQLEGLEGDILKQRDEFDMLVTGEMSRFSALITELEEKKEQSARELLTVRLPGPAACLASSSPASSLCRACPLHLESHPNGRRAPEPEILILVLASLVLASPCHHPPHRGFVRTQR